MEWISVKDRLPKNGTRVLGYRQNVSLLCLGVLWYNEGFYIDTTFLPEKYCDSFNKKQNVEYWMTIPEPPKED